MNKEKGEKRKGRGKRKQTQSWKEVGVDLEGLVGGLGVKLSNTLHDIFKELIKYSVLKSKITL